MARIAVTKSLRRNRDDQVEERYFTNITSGNVRLGQSHQGLGQAIDDAKALAKDLGLASIIVLDKEVHL